jgi:hypothetical protein
MPEPLLYGKAMIAAALASAACTLMLLGRRRPQSAARGNLTGALGMGLGLTVGYYFLNVRPAWPPASSLDRFLVIVLPIALGIESLGGATLAPPWLARLLRVSWCAAIGMILLHNSVYVSGTRREWSRAEAVVTLAVCGALLAVLWMLVIRLSRRSPGVSLPLTLAMSIQTAGAAIMLGGYLQGGAAAFPLTAALAATALVLWRCGELSQAPSLLSVGVVGLFSLLFIGRYFGNLSTISALAILLAPLLSWVTEIPWFRRQRPWVFETLRLAVTATPLVIVLIFAKLEFDRKLGPLLL